MVVTALHGIAKNEFRHCWPIIGTHILIVMENSVSTGNFNVTVLLNKNFPLFSRAQNKRHLRHVNRNRLGITCLLLAFRKYSRSIRDFILNKPDTFPCPKTSRINGSCVCPMFAESNVCWICIHVRILLLSLPFCQRMLATNNAILT